MRKYIKATAIFLSVILFLCVCGCGDSKRVKPNLSLENQDKSINYSFMSLASPELELSKTSAKSVLKVIKEQNADYFLSSFYEMDEIKKRLNFNANVSVHKNSALDQEGKLNAAYLTDIIIKNNEDFLKEKSYRYEKPDREYILDICTLIVDVTNKMTEKYPEIDWERVYCNLGNLKILYNTGMLSYAQVSDELILSVSKNNTEIVLNMKGENGFRNVLIHELMHIIQIGCLCENIENCSRRAGISLYWEDFPLNTADWVWFVEGSAERNMCNITGDGATTYQYKMDYICSCTMSVLLREDIKADTFETICFYSDPELLFKAFGCESETDREEIINLMTTLNILQMQPEKFYEVYKDATGIDVKKDEETLNEFSYSLKPAVCVTLSKIFYKNLVDTLSSKSLTVNDLFCLISMFEGHLNQHLNYKSQEKYNINKTFFDSYLIMRDTLFEALGIQNNQDFDELYTEYNIEANGKGKLNATLNIFDESKKNFIAERAQWQAERNALGEKVISVANHQNQID